MYLSDIAYAIRLQVVAGRSSMVAAMHAPPTARGAIGKAELSTRLIIRGQAQCITAFVLTFENAIGVLLRRSFLKLGRSR
jgi:hypothetical protein